MFKQVESKVNFPAMEESVLQFWRSHGTFEKSLKLREAGQRYVFYEGPPTANGLPGVHHVLARVFKDLFPRYKTMKGYFVSRRSGWDCHGLPVELEVEKRLGLGNKQAVEKYGVAQFNAECRQSVVRYVADWARMTDRIGFWIDLDEAYWTMSNGFVESVWWILKQMWDQGLLYRGYKVVPYCPRCGTPLSSHEVAQGYEETEDPSVYVRFPRLDDPSVSFLVWTTTPWTLPGNAALAIHPDLEYVLVENNGEKLILARALLDRALQGEYKIIRTVPASELLGLKYRPPFSFVNLDRPAHYVIAGEFVTSEDGTGIVHIAPAFGEDDLRVGQEHNLPVLQPVDLAGAFTPEVTPWAGKFVKDADPEIIKDLRDRGILYREQKITHTYPFCWRCDTPLLYYARGSWFIAMSRLRDQLMANNDQINWYPEHIKDGRFGNWLAGVQDWAISRERFWGTPLPIWVCEDCGHEDIVGSFSDLRERSQETLPEDFDPHRPLVDKVTLKCEKCGGVMRRVPDLIDVWFDSGSMPYGQWHYPFANTDEFESSYPADFICEAVDQTRGWFYSLHAISTAVFNKPAYKNVICLGLVLDAEGEKMSKSLGNIVDPWQVLNTHGADALRWYLFTATPPGNARRFSVDLVGEVVRKFLLTLWNTYSFFVIYANIDRFDPAGDSVPEESRPLMDRWILSELHSLVGRVSSGLDNYDVTGSARAIESFVDDLSNWYVRRNRRRFWKSENDSDKRAAYLTLYECLVTVAQLLAPFAPFVSEEIYQNLVRSVDPAAAESVHLSDFPAAKSHLVDHLLVEDMQTVIRTVGLGRAARNKSGLKIRQPLAEVVVKVRNVPERDALLRLKDQVLDELNVKDLRVVEDPASLVEYTIKPNLPVLGPKYGRALGKLREALDKMSASEVVEKLSSGAPLHVDFDGSRATLEQEDLIIETRDRPGYAVSHEAGTIVALNTHLSEELLQEGLIRDLVRQVQSMRKEAGFNIEDTIRTYYRAGDELSRAIGAYTQYFKGETLSVDVIAGEPPEGAYSESVKVGQEQVQLGVVRAK